MHDHLNKAPPRLRTFCPEAPEAIESVVMAALTKDPRRRPTARDFLSALQSAYKETLEKEELAAAQANRQKQTTVVVFAEYRNQPAEPRAITMPIPMPPQGFVAISLSGEVPPPSEEEPTAEEQEAPTIDLEVIQRAGHQDPTIGAQILNHSALDQLQRLGLLNGNDVAPDLVQVFRRDAETRILALSRAFDAQDTPALERTAHSLKSSCGNLGAERLQLLCQSIENRSRHGDITDLDGTLVQVQQELALFNRALDDYLSLTRALAQPMESSLPAEASNG